VGDKTTDTSSELLGIIGWTSGQGRGGRGSKQ